MIVPLMQAMSIHRAAEVLKYSQDADERQAAARALGRLCEEAAEPVLLALSKEYNAVVRRTAKQALAALEVC